MMDEEHQNPDEDLEKLYELVHQSRTMNSLSAICQMLRILTKRFFRCQVPVLGYHWYS